MAELITSSKRLIVVGMGATGLSVARYLTRQGQPFMMVDSREAPPNLQSFQAEFPEVPVETGPLKEDTLLLASEIIVSPGVALSEPALVAAKQADIAVIGDIELFARHISGDDQVNVIAITGSNGKSTVTTLVGEMCAAAGKQVAVGGNLGTPALDLLDSEKQLYVLELSSFQLETVEHLNAEVSVVLNISPDHMDRYNSMVDYHSAKHRIFKGVRQVVVNRDEPLSQPLVSANVPQCSFGLGQPDLNDFGVISIDGKPWLSKGVTRLIAESDVMLKGQHNIANCLASLALGEAVGLPMSAMLDTLRSFKGLPHRCQTIPSNNDITYINDSKATNVGATIAAISGFASDQPLILIAGGQGKGQDFSPLRSVVDQAVSHVVLIGEDADQIAKVLTASHRAASLEQAVSLATELAGDQGIVLFSPACASFDMFNSFEHRGDCFAEQVGGLQ